MLLSFSLLYLISTLVHSTLLLLLLETYKLILLQSKVADSLSHILREPEYSFIQTTQGSTDHKPLQTFF